jgi:hypothetical protein
MSLPVRSLTFALLVAAFVPGCRAVLGIDAERELARDDAGSDDRAQLDGDRATDVANLPIDAPVETAIDTSIDASIDADDDATTPLADDAAAAPATSLEWANWPIPPESPADTQYTVRGDVVFDSKTGLTWEFADRIQLTYDAAAESCAALRKGGASDWRVPTWIELLSIVDWSRRGPTLSPYAFGYVRGWSYWSRTTRLVERRVMIDFADGYIFFTVDPTFRASIRCVRGGAPFVHDPAAGAPAGRYATTAATARDRKTGLLWQRGHAGGRLGYEAAVGYCANLSLDGVSGFRLPHIREILSIIDVDGDVAPIWDHSTFGTDAPRSFWSSTVHAREPQYRWGVTVTELGLVTSAAELGVRCVRD